MKFLPHNSDPLSLLAFSGIKYFISIPSMLLQSPLNLQELEYLSLPILLPLPPLPSNFPWVRIIRCPFLSMSPPFPSTSKGLQYFLPLSLEPSSFLLSRCCPECYNPCAVSQFWQDGGGGGGVAVALLFYQIFINLSFTAPSCHQHTSTQRKKSPGGQSISTKIEDDKEHSSQQAK